jgi:hypothetical protein
MYSIDRHRKGRNLSDTATRQHAWGRYPRQAWEHLPEPRHLLALEIIRPKRPSIYVNLGPHPPGFGPEDLSHAHDLWLCLTGDVVGGRHQEVIDDLTKGLRK